MSLCACNCAHRVVGSFSFLLLCLWSFSLESRQGLHQSADYRDFLQFFFWEHVPWDSHETVHEETCYRHSLTWSLIVDFLFGRKDLSHEQNTRADKHNLRGQVFGLLPSFQRSWNKSVEQVATTKIGSSHERACAPSCLSKTNTHNNFKRESTTADLQVSSFSTRILAS